MAKFVFSDLPITKKLMWIMHGSTLLAVLFASAFFGASEAISYRQSTLDQIATLGGVIGTNSTAESHSKTVISQGRCSVLWTRIRK